jgi:hypothetical protein
MYLHLNIVFLSVVTMGIGYVMAVAGVHKNALEWRRRDRVCPSCGRAIKARVCKCADGASS